MSKFSFDRSKWRIHQVRLHFCLKLFQIDKIQWYLGIQLKYRLIKLIGLCQSSYLIDLDSSSWNFHIIFKDFQSASLSQTEI